MRELRLEVPLGSTVDDAWNAVVELGAGARARAVVAPVRGQRRRTPTRTARSPTATRSPASRRSAAAADEDPASRAGSSRSATTPFAAPTSPRAGRAARDRRGRRRRDVRRPDAGHARARRRRARRPRPRGTPGREVDGLAYEAFEPMALGVLERDRRRDRGAVRACAGSRSSTAPARCRSARRRWSSSPSRPTATRRSQAARYAIDETKARAPIWKAERFTDGHVWIGDVARTGAGADAGGQPDSAAGATASTRAAAVAAAASPPAILRACSCSGSRRQLEALRARATALAAAWGATAAASTTIGQERAILRLFGVVGRRTASGRPLAAEVVDRYLAPGPAPARRRHRAPVRDGDGRVRPAARRSWRSRSRRATWTSGWRRSCSPRPDRRAIALAERQRPRPGRAGPHRRQPDRPPRAARAARRPAAAVDRDRASGRRRSSTPWTRPGAAIDAGAELVRVDVPPSRELAERPTRLGRAGRALASAALVARRPRRATTRPAQPIPTGAQRALAVLRRFVDEAGARRRGYVRLLTDAPALAAPDQAVVAAFERIDLVVADPMREIVTGRVDPDRALADHVFAHRLLARAGTRVLVPAGPLLVAPDLAARRALGPGDPVRPRARDAAARGRAGPARRAGRRTRWSSGRCPTGWSTSPDAPARAAAEIALRRALLPGHPLAFVEPPLGRRAARSMWHASSARSSPDAGDVEAIVRARPATRVADTARRGPPREVAASLRASRDARRSCRGRALDHATRAVAAADRDPRARSRTAAGSALVDQPLGRRARAASAPRPSRSGRERVRPARGRTVAARPSPATGGSGRRARRRRPGRAQVGQCQRGLERRPAHLVAERLARRRRVATPQSARRCSAPASSRPSARERVLHPHRAGGV